MKRLQEAIVKATETELHLGKKARDIETVSELIEALELYARYENKVDLPVRVRIRGKEERSIRLVLREDDYQTKQDRIILEVY